MHVLAVVGGRVSSTAMTVLSYLLVYSSDSAARRRTKLSLFALGHEVVTNLPATLTAPPFTAGFVCLHCKPVLSLPVPVSCTLEALSTRCECVSVVLCCVRQLCRKGCCSVALCQALCLARSCH